MTSWRTLAAVVAVACAGPARGYVRTTAEGTGVPLAWPLPIVAYHVNPDWPGASPACTPAATLDAIQRSFAAWEQPCADLRLLYAGTLEDIRVGGAGPHENVVLFRRGWCSQRPEVVADPCYSDWNVDCGSIYGCFEDHDTCAPGQVGCATRAVVALTSVLYDPATGRIISADIELNGWDGLSPGSALGNGNTPPSRGWYFTCNGDVGTACNTYGQAGCSSMDLQNTVTHEAGHFVGLAHSNVAGATMDATTHPRDISKRDLSPDDVAGVCAIYPLPAGGCGCGGGAGSAASLLLALVALRPLRRRAAGSRGGP